MIYRISIFIVLFTSFFSVSYADVVISSPTEGSLTFSQKKNGEHYEDNSWGKIFFQ